MLPNDYRDKQCLVPGFDFPKSFPIIVNTSSWKYNTESLPQLNTVFRVGKIEMQFKTFFFKFVWSHY